MVQGEALHERLLATLDGSARPALADDGGAWTNVELRAAVERWRSGIRQAAAGNPRPVAVVGEKSRQAVAAIIGTLCAGRAYSTFDPVESAFRVTARLASLRPSAIVDLDGRADAWGLRGFAPIVPAFDLLVPDSSQPSLDASGLAYVLFTSGSTGAPRGVAVGHRAAVLAREKYLETAAFVPGDIVANDIPLIFDVASLDVLGALAGGAVVQLIPLSAAETAGELALRIERSGATHGFTVPTVADLLLADGAVLPPSFRRLFLTGEKVGARLEALLLRAGVDVINAYGMTEAPWVAVGRLGTGRNCFDLPGPNDPVQVEIADDGEIVLRGPGLHSAIVDPGMALGRDPGPVAAYRTGDFAIRMAKSRFEFLGRRDRHVRFDGFRIELGEIESVIEAVAPEVMALAAYDDVSGRLSIGLAPRTPRSELDIENIRARATACLPEYLSSLEYRILASTPQTITGKKSHVRN